MKTRKVSTGMGSNRTIIGLIVLLVFAIAGFITILVITSTESGYDKQYIRHAGELRVLSQEIAKNATEAAAGKAEAFTGLQKATSEFGQRWGYLKNGDPSQALPASPALVDAEMNAVQDVWERVRVDAQQILDSQDSVLALHEVADSLRQAIPQLQAEYDEAIAVLLANRTSASQIAIAQRQSWLAERIISNVSKILEGGDDAVLAADAFELDAAEFSRVYEGMLKGDSTYNIQRVRNPKVLALFENITDQFQVVRDSATQITESSPELFQVREAANTISRDSGELLNKTSALVEHIQVLPAEREISPLMGYACGVAALIIIALLGLTIYRDTSRRLQVQSDTNDQNQSAILRLLDEIADLADGDLTTSATVTEDFTGAIADSINFAIDQLRSLVVSINENSVLVSQAAQQTQATAAQLSEASASQAREISQATTSINDIARSMDGVSGSASESSKVAESSVVIANKGAEAVQNTINGMDKIREQIQKTSKQIKRLGESSQEIGDIVSLINDIADQTNILSLNAAIQASMAGDAGRGFAVVADEVQRLAERSGAATKQIEVLVKTIQADTNEAVISMEQTTSEVVQGARLAQDAGVALEEIEQVSNDLSNLIKDISESARQQSDGANSISKTMNVIQEITTQTSSGSTATAVSIGNLAELANEMSNTVAGFKLPSDVVSVSAMNEDVMERDHDSKAAESQALDTESEQQPETASEVDDSVLSDDSTASEESEGIEESIAATESDFDLDQEQGVEIDPQVIADLDSTDELDADLDIDVADDSEDDKRNISAA